MGNLLRDFKYTLRRLANRPLSSIVLIGSLGLGIGANSVVFSWMQNLVYRPLPGVAEQERMVALCAGHGERIFDTVSYLDLKDYAAETKIFAGIIGSQITPAFFETEGQQEWVYGQIATSNFFDVLGVKPVLGRTFRPEEEVGRGAHPVLVIGEGFWKRRFGGDPQIVGRTVNLNRRSFTIIGVVPVEFQGTMSVLHFDFWAPVTMHQEVANFGSLTNRGDHWLHCQARLQPSATLEQAQAAATVLARQLQQAFPGTNKGIDLSVMPLWKAPYGGSSFFRPVLNVLLAVSLGVLLIVIVNVTNLLLVWAVARQKELAIRQSMGASRWILMRQMMTESLLLALLGGMVGIVVSSWSAQLIMVFTPNSHLPIGIPMEMQWETVALTLGISLLAGLAFGLAPALQALRINLGDTLKQGGRSSMASQVHQRLRSGLVMVEMALALLLLVGAGLCIQGFRNARLIDIGFDPQNLLIAPLRIGMNGYNEQTGLVFYRQLRERLAVLPGVECAALGSWLPLGFEGGPSLGIQIGGYTPRVGEDMSIPYAIISPAYFEAMRIPILKGRDVTDQDDREHQVVAIINEHMARRYWPDQDVLGRKFRFRGNREATIVGVVKGGKYRSLSEQPKSFMYLAYHQGVWDLNLGVVVRTAADPRNLITTLRSQIQAQDPAVVPWATLPYTDYIQAAFLVQRIATTMLLGLGGVALLLAAMGVYAVMAYAVSQRTQEIGVRMALGAQLRDIYRLILSHGMGMTLGGIGIGVTGALVLTRTLSSFLYGVKPYDPLTFFSVSLAVGLVALLACYLPARRAARVDPIVALRYE